jgi:ribosomal-protein-alanine N-acetyltransferase
VTEGTRPTVEIRELRRGDDRWLLALRRENQAFLDPYEPTRPAGFLTPEAQRLYVDRSLASANAAPFVIVADGEPVGTVNISNVVRGAFSSANVGYWVAERWNGRGVATRAVGLLVGRAFGALGLHRLEAGTLVDNVASQRVLIRNGFRPIGVSRRYLHIGGAWRDHLLFARTVDDPPAAPGRPAGDRAAVVRPDAPTTPPCCSSCSPPRRRTPATALDAGPGDVRAERRRLASIGRSKDAAVFVAERDGVVSGCLDARRDLHPGAPHVAEIGFVVAAAARRTGLGRTLLEAAATWAEAVGVTKLEAHVAPTNLPALALLDSLGWRVEGLRPGRFQARGRKIDVLLLGVDLDSRSS